MNKTLAATLLFFLIAGGMGFLFSRWWRERTGRLTLAEIAAIPTPSPVSSNLTSLLARMRPLADNEETIELIPRVEGMTGLVRYFKDKGLVTFTAFLLPTQDLSAPLYLWIKTGSETLLLGMFASNKGGLLISGTLESEQLPAEFMVAPKLKTQMGEVVLSGILQR